MWIIGIGLLLLGGMFFWISKRNKGKLEVLQSTENATVEFLKKLAAEMVESVGAGSFAYKAQTRGKVVCDEPLISELGEIPCVHYNAKVQRKYEETYYQENSEGKRERKTRTGAETVSANRRSTTFYLEDGGERIRIDPDGAEIICEKVISRYEPTESMSGDLFRIGGFSLNLTAPFSSGDRRTLGYSFEEKAISVGDEVFVLGEVTDRNGELRIQHPAEKNEKFIISTRGREAMVRSLESGIKAMTVGAIVCAVIGIVLIGMDLAGLAG